VDADGLEALMESTTARIGVGRAGLRPVTGQLLAFQADLAVTKDALTRVVDPGLLDELGLFTVRTRVEGGTEEYLRRPDLGRRLSEAAMTEIAGRCTKNPDVQLCVGDGLSAQAIEANLRRIFPVIKSGCATAGLSFGTPFFIERCRVGVMNDIGEVLAPRVLILLIGERPGLGRADAMSAYMGYRPHSGLSDADRDVVCNIYDGGGVNPLEAGAYVLRLAQRMIQAGASGVKLKLMEEPA
jgi:ethanolamine ammonia-lyase small subunit